MTTARAFDRSKTILSRMCAVGAVTLMLTLSGCVTAEGGVWGDMSRAVETTTSAVKSVSNTFRQVQEGTTLTTVAETNCEEMFKQVEKSNKQIYGLKVDSDAQSEARQKVLDELSGAAKAIANAQDSIEGTSSDSPEQLDAELSDAVERLSALEDELEARQ
ncbi:hypothetical protein [Brevibacterium sp.]|uniref:hypothetical protein n=1 Tax=Brevibacterium sp. TaxID=1701 RepID=UPI00281259A5|nr:hypothetical protein [Brevibacterium sp.]